MTSMMIDPSAAIPLIIALVLFAIPAGVVLKRIGFSPWWGLLCLVPILALLGLWIMAFIPWSARAVRE